MKLHLFLIVCLLASSSFAQNNSLVLNDNSYMVLANNAYLVIDQPSASGIVTQGTGGNIISEKEQNRVKWNIAANTGSYVVPFTKTSGTKIPLSLNISSAGTGSGAIVFSTYAGPDWNNSTYLPSGVINMCSPDSSAKTIDRFWLMDAASYTTKPALSAITFTYDDAEWSASGNDIEESRLGARWYNSNTNKWLAPVIGTDNASANTVTSTAISANDFYRAWTLSPQECGELFIPNAFTPNGDGENDVFYIRGGCIKELDFVVFNRWGGRVFHSDNPAIGWDGDVNGERANSAVFVWHMKALLANGETVIKKGNITLLR